MNLKKFKEKLKKLLKEIWEAYQKYWRLSYQYNQKLNKEHYFYQYEVYYEDG